MEAVRPVRDDVPRLDSAPELSALQLLNAADILAWRQVSDETVISSRIVQAQSQLDELAPDQRRVWNRQFASFWCASSELAVGAAVLGEQALAMWRSRLCRAADTIVPPAEAPQPGAAH